MPHSLSLVPAAGQSRPYLPPLSLGFSWVESGPNTAFTDDGNKVSTTGSPTWTRSHFPSTAPLAPVLLVQELAHTHGHPSTKHQVGPGSSYRKNCAGVPPRFR